MQAGNPVYTAAPNNNAAVAGFVSSVAAWLFTLLSFVLNPVESDELHLTEAAATGDAGLLAALAGLVSFVFWVIGVVFSSIGLSRSRKRDDRKGFGLSVAGLAICLSGIVIIILLIVIVVAAVVLSDGR